MPFALALLLAAVTAPADSLTTKGVSRELAEYRASRVRDVRYELTLDVTRHDTATGRVTVRFHRTRDGDAILDFRGPRLDARTVNGRPTTLTGDGAHLRIPAALLRPGENTVELTFLSAIAPAGASIIRYHDSTDGADYLYTLLVPSDANALFPCFDQPDLKARVSLTLVTPRGWKALANGALVASDSAAGVSVTHRFRPSDPISTYLIAFAAGPWATRSATADGRPVSIWMRASRAREVEVDSLIAANARAIDWLERYTARPFPFQKFDFLLAPAFPFGGMEHPGAVFYNEESFIYREPPTLNQLLGREATIYHEVSHQWFGDLVTMRWFDDLWLKEGFATYIAAVMQNDLSPRANAWRTFFLRNKPVAYATDASRGTTPVWQALANLDQAKSNYGPIVYNKAPGILKQLNFMAGDTAFRDGLRGYLKAHAWTSPPGDAPTSSGRGCRSSPSASCRAEVRGRSSSPSSLRSRSPDLRPGRFARTFSSWTRAARRARCRCCSPSPARRAHSPAARRQWCSPMPATRRTRWCTSTRPACAGPSRTSARLRTRFRRR